MMVNCQIFQIGAAKICCTIKILTTPHPHPAPLTDDGLIQVADFHVPGIKLELGNASGRRRLNYGLIKEEE